MPLFVTGVGSRRTPPEFLTIMEEIGALVRELGGYLRSGHNDGADLAFEKGARERALIFLPWAGFNNEKRYAPSQNYIALEDVPNLTRAVKSVSLYHPDPESLSQIDRKLMARNWFQIMGVDGETPSRCVVCWAPPDGQSYGAVKGGTGQAVRIARSKGIPVFNMFEVTGDQIMFWLRKVAQNDARYAAPGYDMPRRNQ